MESLSTNVQSKRVSSPNISSSDPSVNNVDISKIVSESATSIKNEKPKRVRRTKAQIEADRLNPSQQQNVSTIPQQPPQPIDRTKELKPAFLLYSDLFLAKPLEIDAMKFTEEEAEALASVTNNLMNAFPEYFNSADPKVTAVIGAIVVAAPIGYTKYKIFQQSKVSKTLDKVKENDIKTN